MKGVAAALLGFEAITLLLAGLLAVTGSDVSAGRGLVGVRRSGRAVHRRRRHDATWHDRLVIGSVVQVLTIATGFLVPTMFFLGALFAGIWVLAYVLGQRIDAMQCPRPRPPEHSAHRWLRCGAEPRNPAREVAAAGRWGVAGRWW